MKFKSITNSMISHYMSRRYRYEMEEWTVIGGYQLDCEKDSRKYTGYWVKALIFVLEDFLCNDRGMGQFSRHLYLMKRLIQLRLDNPILIGNHLQFSRYFNQEALEYQIIHHNIWNFLK